MQLESRNLIRFSSWWAHSSSLPTVCHMAAAMSTRACHAPRSPWLPRSWCSSLWRILGRPLCGRRRQRRCSTFSPATRDGRCRVVLGWWIAPTGSGRTDLMGCPLRTRTERGIGLLFWRPCSMKICGCINFLWGALEDWMTSTWCISPQCTLKLSLVLGLPATFRTLSMATPATCHTTYSMAYILVSPFRFPLRTALHRRAADIQPSAKSTEKGRREAPRGANGALPHHVTPEPLR